MASSSDRARYYLEQSVPELQELLQKEIFTRDEVSAISSKRSEFEHSLSARGSTTADYSRYITYEQNLNLLKQKRIARLQIKQNLSYSSQRRIFFLFERATRKFPGDLETWMHYLEYCRAEKATKRYGVVMTQLLRLNPTNADLWILAAQYAADGMEDTSSARGYIQRGLRFVPKNRKLWVEYVRLEMVFVARKRDTLRVLGDQELQTSHQVRQRIGNTEDGKEEEAYITVTAEDVHPNLGSDDSPDKIALEAMAATPALSGDIPIAIFDAAMTEFDGDATVGEEIFDAVAKYDQVTCSLRILKHISHTLNRQVPSTASAAACAFRLPMVAIQPDSPNFPKALRHSLQLIRQSLVQQHNKQKRVQIAEKAVRTLLPLAVNGDVDSEIQKVISTVLTQTVKLLGQSDVIASIARSLQNDNKASEAKLLVKIHRRNYMAQKELLEQQHEEEGGTLGN